MSSATTEMTSTTSRPAHIISLSLALPLRSTGLYTSLAKALAAIRSCESAVDMDAASTAESSRPEITPVMNTSEWPLMDSSYPRNKRPMMPTAAAKMTISTVHVMPILADFFRLFWDSRDMKRMMIWGIPK